MRLRGSAAAGPLSAVFVHVQKTAGSTIVQLARSAYGNDNIISHGDYLKGVNHFPLKGRFWVDRDVIDRFHRVPFVSGHFGYDFAQQFMRDRYSFTFLRDPFERILSFYYFCQGRDPNEFDIFRRCQQTALNEFLEMGLSDPEVRFFIWNNQVWQLACGFGNLDDRALSSFGEGELLGLASDHLKEFSYVGFAETFERDRDRIMKDLGIPVPRDKIVTNATPGRPVCADLPSSTKDLLAELTRLDQVLYQKAWSRRKSLFRRFFANGS
jgi:hypothetical protein